MNFSVIKSLKIVVTITRYCICTKVFFIVNHNSFFEERDKQKKIFYTLFTLKYPFCAFHHCSLYGNNF